MKIFKSIALWLIVLLVVAVALIRFEGDMLWKIQQYNLFLYSSLFFKQMMVVPGGMLSYLGAFFTQYFFHPQFLRCYNIPEFMKGPVTISPHEFAGVLKGNGDPVTYVTQLRK